MRIYSIRSKSNDFVIYIGSTTQTLGNRWNKHRASCKERNSHLYQYIQNNGGIDNFYIELIENLEGTKEELRRREGEIIREYKANPEYYVLNHRIECRTSKEFYQDNRDYIIKRQKEWIEKNKDKKLEYDKKYYIDNKERILQYQKDKYHLSKLDLNPLLL